MEASARVFLSRRNLLTLLNKLDAVKRGETSACTLGKRDFTHPKFPCSIEGGVGGGEIWVTAVEDEDYYDRAPGEVKVF